MSDSEVRAAESAIPSIRLGAISKNMFRFTTTDNADLHIAVLSIFIDANERMETQLSVNDIATGLAELGWLGAAEPKNVEESLASLSKWELVEASQNNSEIYRTAEEYERRNLLYSLTKKGEAAFAGLEHAREVLSSSGSLQTAVFEAIADRLGMLIQLMDSTQDPRRVLIALQELEGHLEALRVNTKQFNGELQRLMRSEGVDRETFREVKVATIAYLQEFVTNLDQRVSTIAVGIARITDRNPERMFSVALAGANLPALNYDQASRRWLSLRRTRWEGLEAWFSPKDGSEARVQRLHTVATHAIVSLLQTLERLDEARRRSSSAVEDFRTLARWFAVAPREEDLHRLWTVAFGLSPARHPHLHHADVEQVSAQTSWFDAPAVLVPATLRTSGRADRTARPAKIRDVHQLRLKRQAEAIEEAQRAELLWRELTQYSGQTLSAFPHLRTELFDCLLEVLGRALGERPAPEGRRSATSADGQVIVVVHDPVASDSGNSTLAKSDKLVELSTDHGRFHTPDYRLEIALTAMPASSASGETR